MNDVMVIDSFEGRTSEEWLALADNARQTSIESFERSDTDGFLSQWANDQMNLRYRALADVARNGGRIEISAFADIETGEIINGRWIDVQYGSAWAPSNPERGLIFPSNAKSQAVRDRNNAKKGVREITVSAPAKLNHKIMIAYADVDAEWIEVI